MASRVIHSNFFEEQWTQKHPQYLSGLSRTTFLEIAVYSLDLPTSRAQIFSRPRRASGRFFLCFLRQKRARERELVLRAGANYRKGKWEAKDFKKGCILFSLFASSVRILSALYPSSDVHHSTLYLAHSPTVEILLTPLSFSHMRSSTHLRGTLERRGSGQPTVKSLPKKQLRSNICNNTKQKRENVSASS